MPADFRINSDREQGNQTLGCRMVSLTALTARESDRWRACVWLLSGSVYVWFSSIPGMILIMTSTVKHLTEGYLDVCLLLLPCLVVTVNNIVGSELSQELGGTPFHSTIWTHVAPTRQARSTVVSMPDNGLLTAESSTSAFGRQEKASSAPLFIWEGALFESQQHEMHWPEERPSLHNVFVFMCKHEGQVRSGVWVFRRGSHNLTVKS